MPSSFLQLRCCFISLAFSKPVSKIPTKWFEKHGYRKLRCPVAPRCLMAAPCWPFWFTFQCWETFAFCLMFWLSLSLSFPEHRLLSALSLSPGGDSGGVTLQAPKPLEISLPSTGLRCDTPNTSGPGPPYGPANKMSSEVLNGYSVPLGPQGHRSKQRVHWRRAGGNSWGACLKSSSESNIISLPSSYIN